MLNNKHILFFGCSTALDDIIRSKLTETGGVIYPFEELDINKIEPSIKEIVNQEGAFDGIVFDIVHSDFRPLTFVKPDNVSQIMNDNCLVFLELMRSLKKCKGLKNGASVVAMSSISSIRAMKTKTAFCASKAALDAVVRCLAVELADYEIRVNSIQKGATSADFSKAHIKDVVALRGEKAMKENEAPLGVTPAEEIANLVAFLLSDAIRTMTGISIVLDGGYTA